MFAEQHALVFIDLAGIFVFASTGALVAVRKHLDIFGVLVLAGTTGLGGGFLRDVLIGATPPAALADWRCLLVPVIFAAELYATPALAGAGWAAMATRLHWNDWSPCPAFAICFGWRVVAMLRNRCAPLPVGSACV